jgi:hypothetical protein
VGMDFVALMKYPGPDERLQAVLDGLEIGSPEEVRSLAQLLKARGFAIGQQERAVWTFTDRLELRDPRLDWRPTLPTLKTALHLPEEFFLTFGPDAIEVYHTLRWHFFLEEPDLQRAMLDACRCLGRLFGATDCILTSDFSPVVHAFRGGLGFDAALAMAGPEEGERAALADLYREIPEDSIIRFVVGQGGRQRTQYKDWPTDKAPPQGWKRASTWESKGYWRLGLGDGAAGPSVLRFRAPSFTERPSWKDLGLLDERGWATSDDPGLMLDYVLKQERVDWRKVQLWGCACMRRIWTQLATEPSRRAVEVVERFADGQVTQEVVEKAEKAAGSVKKGDRQANRAAWLLTQLCSQTPSFPPSHVSDAVAGTAADSSGQSIERKEHAGLLRDVFGPHPLRAIAVEPSWRTTAVVALARAAYEERYLPSGELDRIRLGILCDALEESGCDNAEIIEHLRGPGMHVRGCHVLDLLLQEKGDEG